MSLTVGQLAKLTGLTVRALHHYDAINLLKPSQRSDSGYRLYTRRDVMRLYRIQGLQRFGLSLSEIGQVLDGESAGLSDMIAQQLEALDNQIRQASTLRASLHDLRDILTRGEEPTMDVWLSAVELMTQYDQHCSPEELRRLLKHNNDDREDWRALIAEIRTAMDDEVSPQSAQAQLLLKRWSALMLRRVGGDMDLAIKMKLAFANDPGMQARMEVQGGASPAMMHYLWQVMTQAHLSLWARHLSAAEIACLRPTPTTQSELLRVMGGLRQAQKEGTGGNGEALRQLLLDLHALIEGFVGGDSALKIKVLNALHDDTDLQYMWMTNHELQVFIRNAEASSDLRLVIARGVA